MVFFYNNDLQIKDFIDTKKIQVKPIWIFIPAIISFFLLACLALQWYTNNLIRNLIFLTGCCSSMWLSASIHIKFNMKFVSVFVLIVSVLIMLVALDVVTPKEMLQYLREIPQ